MTLKVDQTCWSAASAFTRHGNLLWDCLPDLARNAVLQPQKVLVKLMVCILSTL
jgi:hypothetical protein